MKHVAEARHSIDILNYKNVLMCWSLLSIQWNSHAVRSFAEINVLGEFLAKLF